MNTPAALLKRLDEIGISLAATGHGLALIGLGSVGSQRERLDAFSDLDFFAIVTDGLAPRFIENLDWLESVHPIAYAFRNTADGYKLLFQDGIFCEFAVFERSGLSVIPFASGRVIWKRPEISDEIAVPRRPLPERNPADVEWQIGEALTNLYVGLLRFQRGEKLSAFRFIQNYAVDRLVALAHCFTSANPEIQQDPFTGERRFEQRFPSIQDHLPSFMQGYQRSPQSAAAILAFLDQHFEINSSMASAIRNLFQE